VGEDWRLKGWEARRQSVTADWEPVDLELIEGVAVREVRNVLTAYGRLTELYRTDWGLDDGMVDQVFQSSFEPGGVSAWHAHAEATDRLFVTRGAMLVVLFDRRPGSPTCGKLNEFRLGEHRPAIVTVPPRVWHGVRNIGSTPSTLVNLVDRAYAYEQPDHLGVPADSPEVPYDIVGPQG
jgi:dTDP-4-dehydrorhamnose 3,5-epimerase